MSTEYAVHDVSGTRRRVLWLLIIMCLPAQLIADETSVNDRASTEPAPTGEAVATTAETDKAIEVITKSDIVGVNDSIKVLPGVDLLADELPKSWKHFSAKEGTALSTVWQISGTGKDRQLVCTGEPEGFLFTQKQYSEFELTFEWTVPEANANSGVLIYTQNEPRLWPTSIQVQLHQPQAGDIFPSGDAEGNTTQAPPELANPVGEWNKCRIVSLNGQLSVEINGTKAGQVSDCKPSTGFIALQSEGSKIVFRRLILKELKVPKVPTAASDAEGSVEKSEPAKAAPVEATSGTQKAAG